MTLPEENKRIIIFSLTAVVALGALFVYFLFFFQPHSKFPASSFAWDARGRNIYYISFDDKGTSLRSLDTRALFSKGDYEIQIQQNLSPTNITLSLSNYALITGTVDNSKNVWASLLDTEKNHLTPITLKKQSAVFSFSPDAKKIIYASAISLLRSNMNLFSVDTQSVSQEKLLQKSIPEISGLWWYENGEKIAIMTTPTSEGFQKDLYSFDLQTKEITPLLWGEDGYYHYLPHDTQTLFFSQNGVGLMDLETRDKTIVYDELKDPYSGRCVWLDSNNIICQTVDFTANERTFWKINLDVLEKKSLFKISVTNHEKVNLFFSPSPKKDRLAYLDENGIIRIVHIK